MDSFSVIVLVGGCFCFGGLILGIALVFLVQWLNRQQREDQPVLTQDSNATVIQPGLKQGTGWMVMTQGPKRGQTFLIDRPLMRIGRDPDNEFVIDHPQVSRKHASILWQENEFYLEDIGSSNGTFINKSRISGRYRLVNGDVIGLGGVVLLTFYR